jgi:hypothetical protein
VVEVVYLHIQVKLILLHMVDGGCVGGSGVGVGSSVGVGIVPGPSIAKCQIENIMI